MPEYLIDQFLVYIDLTIQCVIFVVVVVIKVNASVSEMQVRGKTIIFQFKCLKLFHIVIDANEYIYIY